MSIADHLVAGLRAQEQEDGQRLRRAEIKDTTDAMNWLLEVRDDAGAAIWDDLGPTRRRKVAEILRWCRDRFNSEWKARGGRES